MAEIVFDYADILKSDRQGNGTILLQTGSVDGPEVRSDNVEVWQPSGYIGVPAKASPNDNPTEAAQAVCIVRGDRDVCIGTRDIRANALVETIGPGEVQVFAGGPNNSGTCKIVLNNDGSGNLRVTITVNSTKIEVQDGTVNISATTVNLSGASDFAALASKVDSALASMSAAISAATCPSGGGLLVFTPPSLPSVAAANVKIS